MLVEVVKDGVVGLPSIGEFEGALRWMGSVGLHAEDRVVLTGSRTVVFS